MNGTIGVRGYWTVLPTRGYWGPATVVVVPATADPLEHYVAQVFIDAHEATVEVDHYVAQVFVEEA